MPLKGRKTPIPTIYAGVEFRSRLEANCAQFLTIIGLDWEYEPISFLLSNGQHYMPDFLVQPDEVWIECRGYANPDDDRRLPLFRKDNCYPAGYGHLILSDRGSILYRLGSEGPPALASLPSSWRPFTVVVGEEGEGMITVSRSDILVGGKPVREWAFLHGRAKYG